MKSKIKNVILAAQILFVLLLVSAGEMPAYASFADDTFAESVSAEQTLPRITLDLQNVTLKEAFKAVEAQSDYRFMYNNSLVNSEKRISIKCNAESFGSVLEKLFANSGIAYKIVDNQVVLSAKENGQIENSASEVKQADNNSRRLQGTITDDSTGEPIAGVAIVVKGKNTFASTDENGKYEIECAPGDVLVFSFLGLETVEMPVNNRRNLSFTMKQDIIALDNLVVTGYQTISKERATGSFNTVAVEQLNKPQTTVEQALLGNVSGLQIINKGYWDREESIIIRGLTSLGANSAPLIIVDGFAIEGTLSSLNPNDIANITVLKDAAAASIWGARSANGVIVVTTKGAQKGKVNVELNAFVKFSPKMDLDYANPLASSAETIEYEKFGFETNFFNRSSPMPDNYSSSIYDMYGDRLYSAAVLAMNENRLGYMTDAQLDAELKRLAGLDNRDQIKKYLLSAPVTQQYNLTISGGTEKMDNILTLMYDNNIGYFEGNKNQRYTLNYRNKLKLFKWLDFNFGSMFQYDYAKQNGTTLAEIQEMSPYDMLLDENGNYTHVQKDLYLPIIDRYITQKGVEFPYSDWTYNPLREMRGRDITNKSIYGRVQAGLTVKIIPGLTIDSKIQYEIMDYKNKSLYSEDTYKVRFGVNNSSTWDGNPLTPVVQNVAKGMVISESGNQMNSWNIRNQINFDRTFAEKHSVSFIGGTEVYERVYETTSHPEMWGYDDNLLSITPPLNGIDYAYNIFDMFGGINYYFNGLTYPSATRSYSTDKYFSLYANASYTYDNKYTISGSYRTDASNLISSDPSIKYSPFWSVGLSWQLGKEKFMQKYSWLDRLVVRATYGFNGNVDKSTSVEPLIYIFSQDTNSGTGYGIISNYGNPNLGWEKTGALNIGVDFAVLNNKLYGSIEYYNKQGRDLISTIAIANVYGTDTQDVNAIEMYNKGVEITLGSSLRKGKFSWNGNLNFAYNKNKITDLYKDKATLAYRVYGPGSGWEYAQGYDAATLWSFRYGGLQEIAGKLQPVIVDKNGENPRTMTTYNTSFDTSDYIVSSGTATPPCVVGFTNSFKYGNWSLSFIVTGYFGHKFRRVSFNYPTMGGGVGNINKYYSEVKNGHPDFIPIPEDGFYPTQMSGYVDMLDTSIEDAGNIRFQEISLSYNLPKSALQKIGLGGIRIYGQLNDVGVITFNKYNQDPFYPMGSYKPGIGCTFGAKINF
ncbi:MAG: SusC/RagA family TonB-linked outer membrane protein [Bacteroidales bacterium]|nr:SusC/RagA family TonB-linked outer membrane protein [Bacteroidales bacterium]